MRDYIKIIPEIETLFRLADIKGITGSEFARRVGVARAYISNVKQGRCNVSIDRYVKMADALGYDVVLIDRDSKLKTML